MRLAILAIRCPRCKSQGMVSDSPRFDACGIQSGHSLLIAYPDPKNGLQTLAGPTHPVLDVLDAGIDAQLETIRLTLAARSNALTQRSVFAREQLVICVTQTGSGRSCIWDSRVAQL
jgi:hypothetical protein